MEGGSESEIVGREQELAQIERALAVLGRGSPVVLEVHGEAGIGKTRLLAELVRRADERGWLALEGRAVEFETEAPFGVFVDALDDYLGSLNPRLLERLGDQRTAELADLFPALASLATRRFAGLDGERYRAHYAARSLLELLAAGRPLVLALDDLHWADEASLELVSHLLRRPPRAAVALAVAYRTPQAPHRLVAAAVAAERAARAQRLELAPLGRADAERLLADAVPGDLRDPLYEQSGGNPFYLLELARAAARGGRRVGEAAAGELRGVPSAVAVALREEIERLRPATLELLQGAAVAGEPFDPGLAAGAAALDAAALPGALDELRHADLIRPTTVPLQFRFRHPIVRHAVYELAGTGWRIAAHRRVACVLEERGAPPSARAPHLERAAEPGDEAAIAVLSQAGHNAAARAPASAARWYQAALRLMPDTSRHRTRRVVLLAATARALGAAGDFARSRDALWRLLEVVPPDSAILRAQVISFISTIETLMGRRAEARALLEQALERLPHPASPEAAALQLELAADRFMSGDFDRMRGWAAAATATAQACDDPPHLASAVSALALADYHLGRIGEARRGIERARALVDGLADAELGVRIEAPLSLGWGEWGIEDYDVANRHFARGLGVSRATGQSHMVVPVLLGRASVALQRGTLPAAAEIADTAVDAATLAGNGQLESWARSVRCWVAIRAGDLTAARAEGEVAVRLADELPESVFSVLARCLLAEARLEAGEDVTTAARDVLVAAGGAELPRIERPFRPYWYEVLASAELAAGRLDEAREWARRAALVAAVLELPERRGRAERAGAAVALAHGDADGAATVALAAAASFGDGGHRLEAARARSLAGAAFAEAGRRREAARELEAALLDLARCGAEREEARAALRLRRLGHRVGRGGRRGQAVDGVASLSGREREVAELVAEGRTNRQIAAQLFLSEKTIESHLTRVFAKLGVSSRAALASLLERSRVGARR